MSGAFAIVVLDVMMPGMSGVEVLRQIRAAGNLPVLMLTARGDDMDRILGLELGADDYVAKPCQPRELAARLRAHPAPGCRARRKRRPRPWCSGRCASARRSASPNGRANEWP